MENNISRMLVETVVKRTLRDVRECPERSIRNLVDIALQFSGGRFQQDFFTTAQTMLQNENSSYYGLVRDTVTNVDAERLYTFGMNLGYNGCTIGAHRIRQNEQTFGIKIPWTVILETESKSFENYQEKYHALIQDGEKLGIYTWMIFSEASPTAALSLAKVHEDSAFFLFCRPENLTSDFLDEVSALYNVMLVVCYDEATADICAALRYTGLPYSVWYPYGQNDAKAITSGDLFCSIQQFSPIFTALIPRPDCPETVQQLVYQTVRQMRSGQDYRTILWELKQDNRLVDSIISDDTCSVCFDKTGTLWDWDHKIECHNLFQCGSVDIIRSFCPKKKGATI